MVSLKNVFSRAPRITVPKKLRRAPLTVVVLVTLVGGGLYGYAHISSFHTKTTAKPVAAQQPKTQATALKDDKPVDLASFGTTIDATQSSVVKIESEACGYIFYGTGFVVAPGLVATNAHVVAGTHGSNVMTSDGTYSGTPVYFDPVLDFAIIRADDLPSAPLALDKPRTGLSMRFSHHGEHTDVLGYPGGGAFTPLLADVAEDDVALSYDIYRNPTEGEQNIFMLSAGIVPGYSGSPVIKQDGSVLGIAYANDINDNGKAMVIPIYLLLGTIEQAKAIHETVNTQTCTLS